MIVETVVVGSLGVNCYIVAAARNHQALIIDPGDDKEKIIAALARNELTAGLVINTHGHYDHIGCDDCFGVDVWVHGDDTAMLKTPELNYSVFMGNSYTVRARIHALADDQEITCDGVTLQVIHTPGHSAGSICLLAKEPVSGILFSGDTLFRDGVGRTDFHGGDEHTLYRSLREKIAVLPDATIIYPGHGPSTTLGREKKSNPFLSK